ncbi:hypothetical protein DOJK_01207 [Patescibacteria group bacterium]|nr:hypothetical protein DOJK_01207 [Patescibacteria group bacterium]
MSCVNPFENLSDEFSVKPKTQKQSVENEKDLIKSQKKTIFQVVKRLMKTQHHHR